MKKLTVLLLVATVALAVVACTSTPATQPPPAQPTSAPAVQPTSAPAVQPTSAPAASTKKTRIAFFVPWTEDVWYVVAIQGAKAEAEKLGVQLDVFDASNKLEQQIQQFDTALASKPDAIVLSSVDPAGMVPSVEKAHDAGVKVVVYDRPIYTTTKLDALLILDTANMGDMACKAIVDSLTKKYGEPKGKVIRVYGDLADTWVTGISQGWDPCMAKYPNITVLKAMSGQWAPDQAAANVQQLLTANKDVDAMTLDSDWLGSGIVTNLKAGNYGKVGEKNHIFFIGNGGMAEALQYIREGYMDSTINNPVPDFTGAAVDIANMLATGKQLPAQYVSEGKPWSPAPIFMNKPTGDQKYTGPVLNMGNFIVDKSNVDDPTLWGNMASKK